MIGWFFVFLNEYGTDQVTVQRLLSVRQEKGVIKAIAFNAVNDVVINGMLIFIGIGMFAYFQAFPERLEAGVEADGMLPYYIMHVLPAGVSGLLVTAIFAAAMSSVDSGINSLSTVIVNDWIKPWRRGAHADRSDVALARWLTVALGVLATAAAIYAARIGGIVEMWMRVMGLFAAPVLSIFVLGMFTRRAHFVGWLVGACLGVAVTVVLQVWCKDQVMAIWHFPVSFVVTTTVGYSVSVLTPGLRRARC
jgi:Na+/proline symporter